jgi:chemotaxis protein MotB
MSYAYDETPFIRPDETVQSNAWMISFADLLSLKLTFFILIFSMSEVRNKEWHELTSSLQSSLNPAQVMMRFEEEQPQAQPLKQAREGLNLSYVYTLLKEQLGGESSPYYSLRHAEQEIIISLKSDALFASTSADFSREGLPLVEHIATAVAKLPNKMEVKGHSDPRPIERSGENVSNWGLSLARADSVARIIAGVGYSRPIDVFGLADSRYNSSFLNDSAAQREALARRVDIIIKATEDY